MAGKHPPTGPQPRPYDFYPSAGSSQRAEAFYPVFAPQQQPSDVSRAVNPHEHRSEVSPPGSVVSWPGREPAPPSKQQMLARRNDLVGTGYYEQAKGGSEVPPGNEDYFRNGPKPELGENGTLFRALYIQYKDADDQARQAVRAYHNCINAFTWIPPQVGASDPIAFVKAPFGGNFQLRTDHGIAYQHAVFAMQWLQEVINLREEMKADYPGYDSWKKFKGHDGWIRTLKREYNTMLDHCTEHGSLAQAPVMIANPKGGSAGWSSSGWPGYR